jgi:hypothetical protein
MAWFLLGSNTKFCAIFRRQAQKSCQETAGRLFIEGGVVVITNETWSELVAQYDRGYGPYFWKKQAFDYDMLNLQPWFAQVRESRSSSVPRSTGRSRGTLQQTAKRRRRRFSFTGRP